MYFVGVSDRIDSVGGCGYFFCVGNVLYMHDVYDKHDNFVYKKQCFTKKCKRTFFCKTQTRVYNVYKIRVFYVYYFF